MGINPVYFTPSRFTKYDRDVVELGLRVTNEFFYHQRFGAEQVIVRVNQADKRCKRYLEV